MSEPLAAEELAAMRQRCDARADLPRALDEIDRLAKLLSTEQSLCEEIEGQADKDEAEIERLKAELNAANSAARLYRHEIEKWAEAYPESAFPVPPPASTLTREQQIVRSNNSAAMGRHMAKAILCQFDSIDATRKESR